MGFGTAVAILWVVKHLNILNNLPVISGRKLAQALALLLVIALCIMNALLIKQNRDLKAVIARMTKRPEILKPGQYVPPLTASSLVGQQHQIDYASSAKTVLLVFSTQCPACEPVLPYWREIEEICRRDQYQIFGISLDDATRTEEFLASKDLGFEALVDVSSEMRDAYKLYLTPQTIVIDATARVEKVWPGAFSPKNKHEIGSYFGISVMD